MFLLYLQYQKSSSRYKNWEDSNIFNVKLVIIAIVEKNPSFLQNLQASLEARFGFFFTFTVKKTWGFLLLLAIVPTCRAGCSF